MRLHRNFRNYCVSARKTSSQLELIKWGWGKGGPAPTSKHNFEFTFLLKYN